MASRDYQIVFRGRLVPGQDVVQVKRNLAQLFKVDDGRIEKMFSGSRQVLKKGLDRDTADKYRQVLKKAGAIVAVVSEETQRSARSNATEPARTEQGSGGKAVFAVDDPTPGAAPARAVFAVDDPQSIAAGEEATGDPAGGSDDDLLAQAGEQIVPQQPFQSLDFDIEGLTLAESGVIMDATPKPPAAEIDTAGMAATDEFEALDEKPPPAPPQIDTRGLVVDEEDSPVDSTPRPAPAQIDTSGLSASDEFEDLDESPAAAAPAIDTSHLQVKNDPV